MIRPKNKAQSLIEYTILITLAAAALLAVRTFMLRSIQEKYRQGADTFGQGEQ